MTTFTKRRARPVRPPRKERDVRRLLLYIGVALGFAGIGFVASLGGRSSDDRVFTAHPIGGRPSAVSAFNGGVFVADDGAHVVRDLDQNGKQLLVYRVARNPIAITVDDGTIWVGHASGIVTRIFRERMMHEKVGSSITSLAYDGRFLWAADLGAHALLELDPVTLRVLRRVGGVSPVRVIATDRGVFATTASDEVVRYASGRITRVRVGAGPIGLAFDGRSVWTADSDAGTVTQVDATAMRVVRHVRVGRGPTNVAVGHSLFVANADDRTLSRIDLNRGKVVGAPIAIDTSARSMVTGWLVGTDPSEIVRIYE